MPINVRFGKNGFYHPAFGRMGLGKMAGDVYTLPDLFREEGMLPKSAVILEDPAAVSELLEEQRQRKPHAPKVIDEEQLEKARERAKALRKDAGGEDKAPTRRPRRAG
jgi:hypothetical protein